MNTLAIAFAVAWFAVAVYIGWIGHQQRLLAERLRETSESIAKRRQDGMSNAA